MICYPSSLDARIELVVISIAVLFLVDGKITHPTILMTQLTLSLTFQTNWMTILLRMYVHQTPLEIY